MQPIEADESILQFRRDPDSIAAQWFVGSEGQQLCAEGNLPRYQLEPMGSVTVMDQDGIAAVPKSLEDWLGSRRMGKKGPMASPTVCVPLAAGEIGSPARVMSGDKPITTASRPASMIRNRRCRTFTMWNGFWPAPSSCSRSRPRPWWAGCMRRRGGERPGLFPSW